MNQIGATVTDIQKSDSLSVVSFEAYEQPLRMVALELDKTLVVGSQVTLGVKATKIALAKDVEGELSISNQIDVSIESVNNGSLLSSVLLHFGETSLESIITRESSIRMNLQAQKSVTALIQASDLSIFRIHNKAINNE
ncbi:MAG: transporter [Campylobacterota bacterium]|nr:transporter [Campylobacterota bacterium]